MDVTNLIVELCCVTLIYPAALSSCALFTSLCLSLFCNCRSILFSFGPFIFLFPIFSFVVVYIVPCAVFQHIFIHSCNA